MANNDDAKLKAMRDKSSNIVYGSTSQLNDENETLKNIIAQTISDTKKKIGIRTNEQPINYFNEINFGVAFNELIGENKNKKNQNNDDNANFKKIMSEQSNVDMGSLLLEDGTRTVSFNNYRMIHKHIPECAQALNIYKDNIISPDDYTKLIFDVSYEKADEDIKKVMKDRLDMISEKYSIEDKAMDIIEESLLLGESYTAVLSLENELSSLLSESVTLSPDAISKKLQFADVNAVSIPVLKENIDINNDQVNALNECLNLSGDNALSEAASQEFIASHINNNIKIGSSREFLLERTQADYDLHKNEPKKKRKDSSPLYINGSVIRRLAPERVVELRVDNICYGYYYAEEVQSDLFQQSYVGTASGRNITGQLSLSQNTTIAGGTQTSQTPNNQAAQYFNVGEQKLKLISDLFINAISKKIDKEFVRNNKQFKDFIYDLLKQKYIIEKGIKLTYFLPEEVIKFEVPAVYKDITFFAKLYLAILTNNLLIKLGRAHDKRIFYVNVGADAAYEQAIQNVIADVKTKDYKMETLNDINSVLQLNPGRFDDYFMPTINGERPIEIDTLQGMDVDMNNEFVEYLKNSMMSGMGVPTNLIDVTSEVDYARSVSAMNANFVRSVIKYQKKLTPSFTRLYQILYKNEFRFNNDKDADMSNIDLTAIRVQFPSPATLAMTNISDRITAADQNADFIASQIVPIKTDGSTEDLRVKLKTMIIKDMLPSIDWNRYEAMVDEVKRDNVEEKLDQPKVNQDDMNPYGGAY